MTNISTIAAVMPAENGRVALDILASKRGRKIDIILTDVKMPEVTHNHPRVLLQCCASQDIMKVIY